MALPGKIVPRSQVDFPGSAGRVMLWTRCWHTSLPALAGSEPHCTHCSGICCRRCTTTPSAWGSSSLVLPDHISTLRFCQPQAQTSQIFLALLAWNRTCSTEQLPCPFPSSREVSLEQCLGQGCFHYSKYASLRGFLQSDNT